MSSLLVLLPFVPWAIIYVYFKPNLSLIMVAFPEFYMRIRDMTTIQFYCRKGFWTCYDLITFLLVQTFLLHVCFQIICTVTAFSNFTILGNHLLNKIVLALKCFKKGKQVHEWEPQRWRPDLKHSFINTGWQGRSPVPDNEEGVAIFFKLSGDRENKNDIQLTNEQSLT